MSLLVQEYLKNHTFGDLIAEHGVYASFSKSGHKFSLNYDQIEAKESDPLAQECRGLVLALVDGRPILGRAMPDGKVNRDTIEPGETVVLAYPMRRFFNYGQGAAAEINWSDPNLAILEKLDGTLCIVYHDKFAGQWCVATRSVPEADLPMDNGKFTFRTLFDKAVFDTIGKSFTDFTSELNKEVTYCFELTTPYNRIVVKYDTCSVTLLAARQVTYGMQAVVGGEIWASFNELNINDIRVQGIPKVKSYTFTSIEDIHNFVSNQNPLEHEGVVVRDSNFNRIKVKNAAYVAFNRARDILGASDRNCLELILAEKEDDVMPALPPEIQENLLKIKEGYRNWLKEQEEIYLYVRAKANAIGPEKKIFALELNKHKVKFPAVHFNIFDGKATSVKDFITKARKDGTWPNSLLDKIIESINKPVPTPFTGELNPSCTITIKNNFIDQ